MDKGDIIIGNVINIYEDPATKKKLEGQAEIRRIYRRECSTIFQLGVIFTGEKRIVTRRVMCD
jgi:hypothetical protein